MNRGGEMGHKMHTQMGLMGIFLIGILVVSGCSKGKETEPADADQTSVAETVPPTPDPGTPEPTEPPIENPPRDDVEEENVGESPVTEPTEDPAPVAEETPAPTEPEAPEPVTPEPEEPAPQEDEPAPDPVKEMPNLDGQVVNVADTKPGLTRIGAAKCKMCHKIQYASWLESGHAKRDPQIDCESCHGSGSEYKKKSVMEDPALAKAAGLVTPEKAYCDNCHLDDWQADYLERSHAHKDDAEG